MGLCSVYFLCWYQSATYNLASMYFPRFLERYHRVLSCRIICRRPRKNLISMLVRLRSPSPDGGRFWNNLCWSTRTLAKIEEALGSRREPTHTLQLCSGWKNSESLLTVTPASKTFSDPSNIPGVTTNQHGILSEEDTHN